jgi:hypothetical protein
MDRVHVSVDRPGVLGPPWTDGGADRGGPGHGGTLTGARPPAAPVRQISPAGAQKGERSTGSSARPSPELGRHCGDRATVVQNREAAALGEGTAQAWREEKKRGKVWCYSGVVLAFYRGQGSAGEGWPGRLMPALMALTPLKTREGLRGKFREGK